MPRSALSQLESGATRVSEPTLWALAVVLEVPFSRLVEPPVAPGDRPHTYEAFEPGSVAVPVMEYV